ncbi:MAG TPA: hypothetical protein VFP63_01440, partial [Dehalococcoidia bacterium]|nr:hypothetical protein [Dehalococcoidia bacterium]
MRYHLPSSRLSPGRLRAAAAVSLCLATGLLILAACGGNDSTPPAPQGTLVLGPQETCNRDLATAPPDV